MSSYDHIALIYNPKSTGDAAARAKKLANKISSYSDEIGMAATLTPTKHAMHAHELAEEISLTYKHPLIVSVSGDGGYNEVVNGVMSAKAKQRNISPVVAVVDAGNANDHKRMTRGQTSLVKLIRKNEPQPLDLIRLTTADKSVDRYAHSYIGLGISPLVGHELNKTSKSAVAEAVTLMKTFWSYEPFDIIYKKKKKSLDSLVFANISEMAKVLKLEPETDVTNNRFRVVEFVHVSKLRLLYNVARALFASTKSNYHTDRYTFTTTKKELVQFDGEIESIKANIEVTISSQRAAVDSLYDIHRDGN